MLPALPGEESRVSRTTDQLVSLQEHDRRMARLRRERESIPRRRAQLEAALADLGTAREEAEQAWKSGVAEAHRLDLEVEALRARIRRFQAQQLEVKSNDDYRTLVREIEEHQRKIRGLEDRELEQMEENEALRARAESRKKALAEDEKAVREEEASMGVRAARIEEELDALEAERREMIEDVDPAWLSRYDRLLDHVGDFAVVPVENGTCGGCHMKLPPQVVHDARRAESIIACAFCGRLLYCRA